LGQYLDWFFRIFFCRVLDRNVCNRHLFKGEIVIRMRKSDWIEEIFQPHYCPDWDYLYVTRDMQESKSCGCPQTVKREAFLVIEEVIKNWEGDSSYYLACEWMKKYFPEELKRIEKEEDRKIP